MMRTQRTERTRRTHMWPYLARSHRLNSYEQSQKEARWNAFERARSFHVPSVAYAEDGADVFMAASAACKIGDFVKLNTLLGLISPNDTRPESFTLMREAILEGHTECVQVLLARGADVNLRDLSDKFGCTPLMDAISFGHDDIVALLLQQGANPNLADSKGRTALHYAVGQPKYVMWLLQYGADVHAVDKHGRTALMDAYINKDSESSNLLLNAGSDVNSFDNYGMTAAHIFDIVRQGGRVHRRVRY